MSKPRRNLKGGFTLVELLVTITIFVILTGVVLFNQSKFNSTILLTNLAYDTALTIRQAQTYGINIKEFNLGGTGEFLPYGVHFDTSSPKSFILFADIDYDILNKKSDGIYDGNNDIKGIDLSVCQNDMGCVNRYNIQRGNSIGQICNEEVGVGRTNCDVVKNLKKLDIMFVRPNPNAIITAVNSYNQKISNISVVTIILKGADGTKRKVVVRSNGLIEVAN